MRAKVRYESHYQPQLLRDFFQYFTHAEKGVINLFKGLAIRPGKVAAEYVEGKRKTYFNPFTFLALCIAFMAFLNSRIKPYNDLSVPDPKIMARMPDERLKNLYVLTVKRNSGVQEVANRNLNLLSVAVTPYFAFFLWLFFRRRKRNMAEISVAYILFTGFANVLTTILISPWLAMTRNTGAYYPIFYGSMLLQTFYFAWGIKETFFNYTSVWRIFKSICRIGAYRFDRFYCFDIHLFFVCVPWRGDGGSTLCNPGLKKVIFKGLI